ncbi:uncharacterized protein [Rutidosis leptorrhynchoides]|uniref:uncharacterized protein n=1 Tax=Rutidosis leptorrhynchoides TaxID=125765 RepID=UPI003A99EEBB
MASPRTVKEVQSLTGKLDALTCFLFKAAERQLPFFKALKDCLKQKSFVWSSEAEVAFQEMKKLLKTLPTLTAPIDGEILYLYISVINEAFGSVLIAERDKIQKPVYFVSKALTGSEINYAPIEKFVYALILTSRRLRRYFQGHPKHVLTNMPIKQVLTKPEISGRLTLWAAELGTYQISYLPRGAVKGQVMADYLPEMSGELEGAGAGLVLASPSGEEHTYALRFNFDVTNNEAVYEAILAGLNIARKMNITKLRAFTDLQLVANQFNGSFDAHDSSMQKYLQLLKESTERFEHFELVQVEELPSKSIDNDLMVSSVEEEQPNWMEPILHYIRNDTLPSDKREARLSYCSPMMRCVGPIEAEMIVDEMHSGSCALHSGYKTIAARIMRMGYFWPSLYHDVAKIVKRWPFPTGPGNVKFLIVAIEYFTKWVEAKAVRTITGVQVRNFVWEYIVCRFGISCELVSDNGAQIAKDPFKTWCTDLNIIQQFTSVAHPQANGLCEVTNRDIGLDSKVMKKPILAAEIIAKGIYILSG